MPAAVCPNCDEEITVPRRHARVGRRLTCQECGALLEVIEVDPIELDYAPDEGEYDEEEEDNSDNHRRRERVSPYLIERWE